jgi:hypothetical protein
MCTPLVLCFAYKDTSQHLTVWSDNTQNFFNFETLQTAFYDGTKKKITFTAQHSQYIYGKRNIKTIKSGRKTMLYQQINRGFVSLLRKQVCMWLSRLFSGTLFPCRIFCLIESILVEFFFYSQTCWLILVFSRIISDGESRVYRALYMLLEYIIIIIHHKGTILAKHSLVAGTCA